MALNALPEMETIQLIQDEGQIAGDFYAIEVAFLFILVSVH